MRFQLLRGRISRQILALSQKNALIFYKSPFWTFIRALIFPLATTLILIYCKEIFTSSQYHQSRNHGIASSSQPIKDLAAALGTTASQKLVFVRNGVSSSVLDPIINGVVTLPGVTTHSTIDDPNGLYDECPQTYDGTSECFAAIIFTTYNATNVDYIIAIDKAESAYDINYDSHSSLVLNRLFPLQWAVESHIGNFASAERPSELPYLGSFGPKAAEYYSYDLVDSTGLTNQWFSIIALLVAPVFMLIMMGVVYHLAIFVATERESGMSELLAAQTCTTTPRMLSTYLSFSALYGPGWIISGGLLGGLLFTRSSAILIVFMHILAGLSITSSTHLVASLFRKAQLAGLWSSVLMFALAFVSLSNFLNSNPSITIVYALSAVFPPITYSNMISDIARDESRLLSFSLAARPLDAGIDDGYAPYPQISGYYYVVFYILQTIVYGLAAYGAEKWLWGVKRDFQRISDGSDTVIRTTGLTKTFKAKGGRTVAVEGLDLELKRGSVTYLLGPNGGGKTTTLKCLAGMYAHDAGSKLEINDEDLAFGVCPQGNVFWDTLTVAEHIKVWTKIKTAASDRFGYDDDVLVECDLLEKAKSPAKTLSGGQMRKLQLAIAFVGGSKMCFIDEASSGLDPLSRQNIWTIISKGHSRRTVLMTTHFLDEADILADHIAIVYQGRLVCSGSSTALKSTFGNDFVVKEVQTDDPDHLPQSWQMSTSADATRKVLELERNSEHSYNVEFPTLDQVFLKVTNSTIRAQGDQGKAGEIVIEEVNEDNENAHGHGTVELEVGKSTGFLRQILVIIKKRYLLLQSNWFSCLIALATPIIIAAVLNYFMSKRSSFMLCSDTRTSFLNPSNDEAPTNLSPNYGWFGPLNTPLYSPLADYDLSGVLGPSSSFQGAVQDALFVESVRDDFLAVTSDYSTFVMNMTAQNILATRATNATSLANVIQTIGDVNGRVGFGIFDSPGNITIVHNSDTRNVMAGLNLITNRLANSTAASGTHAPAMTAMYRTFRHVDTSHDFLALPISIFIVLGLIVSVSVAILYPVYERLNNARSLQYCNGVSPAALWIAYTIFEMQIGFITTIFTWVLVFGTGAGPRVWYEAGYIFGILLLFCLASYLGIFVISHIVKKAAFAIAIGVHLILFVIYLAAYFLNQSFGPPNKKELIYTAVHGGLGLTSPAANLARGLFVGINNFDITCGATGYNVYSPGSYELYGGPYCNLVIQIIFLILVLYLLEYGSSEWWFFAFRKRKGPQLQSLKAAEAGSHEAITTDKHVNASTRPDGTAILEVSGVSKSFGQNPATKDISLSIPASTTLALLGPNGAGKTTMINMIRGILKPDAGTIHIDGVNVALHPQLARSHMGVCPQDDAIDELTVKQTVEYYAAMKGVRDIKGEGMKVLGALGIQSFAAVRVKKLSGGTRRKLMVCIALLGNPKVLLLDEPSTGQDAGAKRVLWDVLKKFQAGRAILLTTHSMEETEALASHISIVGTRMLASGSLTQLRNQYGGFYRIRATYDLSVPPSTIEETIRARFSNSIHSLIVGFGEVEFEIPHETRNLGRILTIMEELKGAEWLDGTLTGQSSATKEPGIVSDYTVMEPDMNEVFMAVCRAARLQAV